MGVKIRSPTLKEGHRREILNCLHFASTGLDQNITGKTLEKNVPLLSICSDSFLLLHLL